MYRLMFSLPRHTAVRIPRRKFATSSSSSSSSVPLILAIGGLGAAGLVWSQWDSLVGGKKGLGLAPLAKDTSVVFVLGGPGAGKGTQCANLVRDYGFEHLSAGDLLREERNRKGSPYGELINNYIKEGKIVPFEITIALLHAAMQKSSSKRFLVDGFPRAMDQAEAFEKEVCKSKWVLYFECPEEEMLKRLMKRGETSGRIDDNIESIKKRFATFRDTSYPVIEHYGKLGKVKTVSCKNTVDGVYKETKAIFDKEFQ
ncbi:bifunctional uridylate/adenylate kinase [Phlyctochytrium planicorne]|nr:bifunctional uridylate/adenylate kinase [Phlyctochytrium planicorne]